MRVKGTGVTVKVLEVAVFDKQITTSRVSELQTKRLIERAVKLSNHTIRNIHISEHRRSRKDLEDAARILLDASKILT